MSVSIVGRNCVSFKPLINLNCYRSGGLLESSMQGEGCSPPDPHSPCIIPSGDRKGFEGMKTSVIAFKVIASAVLVIAFVILAAFALVLAPFYFALIVKGKAKFAAVTQIIPFGIIVTLLWKIWSPEGMSDTEQAYHQGVTEGQIKASRIVGRIEGARMIAVPEDLSLKPVYSGRDMAKNSSKLLLKENSQGTEIPY